MNYSYFTVDSIFITIETNVPERREALMLHQVRENAPENEQFVCLRSGYYEQSKRPEMLCSS